MITGSDLLIAHGFVKKGVDKSKYKGETPREIKSFIRSELKKKKGKERQEYKQQLHDDADHDEFEMVKNQVMLVDYPKPDNKYYLLTENFHQSIEPLYFWSLNHLQYDLGFGWVEKITDIFSASEHSSFWGAATSRLGLAQDKVQSYMALIGQFVRKDLFQLVRDIRWIDERLDYHRKARKGDKDAITVLKGIWSDLVDGVVQGQRTGANIFQLAQQLGFTHLPTLFFETNPPSADEVDTYVDDLDTTLQVKSILRRKLLEFMTWMDHNFKELKQRKQFELKYLRQHYNIIRMYISWIKPYLTHIERLGTDMSKLKGPDLVAAFEGSMINIEVAAMKLPEDNSEIFATVVMTFDYRTRPQMGGAFTQKTPGYHEGPVHVGETKITWRAYAWTAEQVELFKQMKEREDIELLTTIDAGIKAAMDAIGDELWEYLEQADQEVPKKEEKQEEKKTPPKPGMLDPFKEVGKGAASLFRAFIPKKNHKEEDLGKEKEKAAEEASKLLYTHYKNFKKSHGMSHW
ncbi:hypothetical protein GF342_02550 [Candidatus Woesearchaeota archaeon]|nr:hypothetical protein [Candidatus Woesearchaeota archaeon]